VQSIPQSAVCSQYRRVQCAVNTAEFDNVASLDVNTENNTCINMYLYVAGNKKGGQICKIKIESKSFEKF